MNLSSARCNRWPCRLIGRQCAQYGGNVEPSISRRRCPDGADPAGRQPGPHPCAPDRAAGQGRGRGRQAGRVSRARFHHLLSALDPGGRCARQLFRAQHAQPVRRSAVRSRAHPRGRLLCRLCRTHARRPPLQQRHPGRSRRRDHQQISQGASAGLGRAASGRQVSAAREALFRLWRSRLPGGARRQRLGRRHHGHDDLQRPALAGILARARAAGRRARLRRLQFGGL